MDDDDGSDIHRCSCRRVVVVLAVMLFVVLLLFVVPSRCVANATAATANPPTRSGRRHCRSHIYCRYHCNRIRCSYHRCPCLAASFTAVVDAAVNAPTATLMTQITSMQISLAVAIAVATAVVAAIPVAFAAAIATVITLASAVTVTAACTDISASAPLAMPDAWACGDDSPSRQHALELEAW
jgi:hypothetical protein